VVDLAVIFVLHGSIDLPQVGVALHQVEHIQPRKIISPTEMGMRVWERGVGETLACGTGAAATLVAGVLNGKASRRATIHLLGGNLQVEWNEKTNHAFITGLAKEVFQGETTEG